jgi:hypothetical protein
MYVSFKFTSSNLIYFSVRQGIVGNICTSILKFYMLNNFDSRAWKSR